MITLLCGGVGGSKLADGLYRVLPEDTLTVIANTGDDLEFCGLHVSPDLDTVTYTLADMAQKKYGWGIEGDTFNALGALEQLGAPSWFQVGDRDLATDVFRTWQLRLGQSLTEVTASICRQLGIRARVLPMTDDPVSTLLRSEGEWIEFQEYFVHRRHRDHIDAVQFQHVEQSRCTTEVESTILHSEVVIIANSNPVLSILPILSVPGIRAALRRSSATCVAVSPIVGSQAFTGPAAVLMQVTGEEPSSVGVARLYRGIVHGMLVDQQDEALAKEFTDLSIRPLFADILMQNAENRERVARQTLSFARSLA